MSTVLAVVPFYLPYPGGAEKSMHEMLRRLVLRGFEAEVLVPITDPAKNAPSVDTIDDITVRRLSVEDWFVAVERLARTSDLVLFTLAHIFRSWFAMRLDKALRPFSGKTAYFIRGLDPSDYYAAALVVANSVAVMEKVPERVGVQMVLLTPPVASPRLFPDVPRRFVTIINPASFKGGGLFLDLARRLPRVPFVAQLGRSAPVPGLRDFPNIEVRTPIPELDELYARTRVLLMPSENEPFGRVAIEGALAGCLLLLHGAGGLREVPVPNFCFVDGLSPDVWERRLVQLLEATEVSMARMVRAIRGSAENYDPGWHEFVTRLTALIPQREKGNPAVNAMSPTLVLQTELRPSASASSWVGNCAADEPSGPKPF